MPQVIYKPNCHNGVCNEVFTVTDQITAMWVEHTMAQYYLYTQENNSDQLRNAQPFYFWHNLYLSIVEFSPRFLCNDFNLDFLNPDKASRNVLHGTTYRPSIQN
jgi:hypothetical protein